MNSLLNLLGGENAGISIILQAMGAALRGEDAKTWIRNFAKKDPRLKKVNLDDLYGSAQNLAKENGTSMEELDKQIGSIYSQNFK